MGGKKVCAWILANCEVQLCSTLAAMSVLGVIVMCPMMLDPSIDTLVSQFDEGMCQTVYRQSLRGISNCTWTSCREGCTAEVYSCSHVVVVYVKGTAEDIHTFHNTHIASANHLTSQETVRLGKEEGKQKQLQLLPKKPVNSSVKKSSGNNNKSQNKKEGTSEDDEISADIIQSILGGSINDTLLTSSPPLNSSSINKNVTVAAPTPTIELKKSGAIQQFPEGKEAHKEEKEPEHVPIWILPPDHDLQVYEYNNTFVRDLDANLLQMMNQIRQNLLEIDGWSGRDDDDANNFDLSQANFSMLGIGALLPNVKGCVYPSEIACSDFLKTYGEVGGPVFSCYISKLNQSTVVVTVDKAAAVRHIFYSFIPLLMASGVFTYLFYRVGLIGSKRRKKPADEEAGSDDEGGSQRRLNKERNGRLHNGLQPPVVKKKVRKKFLPSRDSKKKRKGKIFNKKSLLNIKQLSIKSPSPSRHTPSMSIGAISDDGFSSGNNYPHTRTSVNLL